MTDVDEAKARVVQYLDEAEALAANQMGVIAFARPDVELRIADLRTILKALTAAQLANHDVLAMTPPELNQGDDPELHSLLNDGWNTAHWHACDLIRKRIR